MLNAIAVSTDNRFRARFGQDNAGCFLKGGCYSVQQRAG
jgi:hypothetical protein